MTDEDVIKAAERGKIDPGSLTNEEIQAICLMAMENEAGPWQASKPSDN